MKKLIITGNIVWILEATLHRVKGIESIVPGEYKLQGHDFPSHSPKEYLYAVEITIDENILSLDDFLKVFYTIHTPYLNKWEGECFYPLCRSALFINEDDELLNLINDKIAVLNKLKIFPEPIDTKTSLIISDNFIVSPDANINFYKRFEKDPFSTHVIKPKIEKLEATLSHLLKE